MELQLRDRLFEWDKNKNRINRQKHKIDVKTVIYVFEDEGSNE